MNQISYGTGVSYSTRRRRKRLEERRRRRKKILFVLFALIAAIIIGAVIAVWKVKKDRKEFLKETVSAKVTEKELQEDVTIEVAEPDDSSLDVLDGGVGEVESLEDDNNETKTIIKEKLIAKHVIDNPNSSANRNINLARAADIINGDTNGYILEPGEIFSWIEVVGDTTPEKGFLKAPMYKNYESVDDYGGGVCQESCTICSAANDAGILKKGHYHAEEHIGGTVGYLKPENGDMEASVAFSSGKDFWFENTLKHPIRMKIKTKGGKVIVKIWERIEKEAKDSWKTVTY